MNDLQYACDIKYNRTKLILITLNPCRILETKTIK